MKLFLSVLSGVCLALSFPNFNITYFAWVGLIPLFFALENVNPRRAFGLAYLAGFVFFLNTIYWLIHVTLPGMIAFAAFLAVYFGFFGLMYSYVVKKRSYISFLMVGVLWVIFEWLRGHVFGGFPWVLLAHSQSYNLAIIQIADIVGAYGVSFIIVIMNTAIYFTIKDLRDKNYSTFYLAVAIVLIFLSIYYGMIRLNNIFTGEKIKVSVIQGNIPQDEKWDLSFRNKILDTYDEITLKSASLKPDLIIWPETSVPGFLMSENDLFSRVESIAKRSGSAILAGAPREELGREDIYYNSAFLFNKDGKMIAAYDKLHLVPFGEYIPLKNIFSFVEKFTKSTIGDFSPGREYTVFNIKIERNLREAAYKWKLLMNAKFAALVCFEDIFPELASQFVREGAAFLVNITNDAWFGRTSAPYQHAQCSIFRAVENRVNVVRAANTGLSCFIDQKGHIVNRVDKNGRDIFVEGFATQDIVLTPTRTFYTKYGDVFVCLCFICVLLYFIRAWSIGGGKRKLVR